MRAVARSAAGNMSYPNTVCLVSKNVGILTNWGWGGVEKPNPFFLVRSLGPYDQHALNTPINPVGRGVTVYRNT